jgi:CheY-like chemotaxis protein
MVPKLVSVVEDELRLLTFLLQLLESEGYRTVGALSVTSALAMARLSAPDSVLCDFHLPDGTGLDVLRALRADAACVRIPVTITSADIELSTETLAQIAELRSSILLGVPSTEQILKAVAGEDL